MHKIIIKIFVLIFVCNSAYSQFATTCRQQQYQKESYTVFGAMTTLYNGDRKRIMDSLVFRLKRDTIWSSMDVFYVFANLDTSQSKINWITPGTFNITRAGVTTFVADQGYTSNGSTGYLKTGFVPSDSTTHVFRLNSQYMSAYIRTNVTEVRVDFGNQILVSSAFRLATTASSSATFYLSDVTTNAPANADSRGYFSINRTSKSAKALYKNGSSLSVPSVNSISLIPYELYYMCYNADGTATSFSTKQFSIGSIGSGISAYRESVFNTDIEWYMDRLGTGVQ